MGKGSIQVGTFVVCGLSRQACSLGSARRCTGLRWQPGTVSDGDFAQADVNVSLTAISLLWNAVDRLGKQQDAAGAIIPPTDKLHPLANGCATTPSPGDGSAFKAVPQFEELLRLMFSSLQA